MKRSNHIFFRKTCFFGFFTFLFFYLFIFSTVNLNSQPVDAAGQAEPVLKKAGMFEDIRNGQPVNQGVVFSSGLGSVVCYTDFDPVHERTFIYHKYYFRDRLSSRIKLALNPPRWATHSRIQLRETDKGPWRVEITDEAGTIIHVIRFSITD